MMQELIAILLVGACVAYVGYQLLSTLRTGQGKAGKCCSRGCDAMASTPTPVATPATPKEQFFPSDMLRRKKV